MSGLISLPWSFKPIFGYLFDKAVVKLNSTKQLIIVSCILRVFANITFATQQPDFILTYFLLFTLSMCKLIENITCEYLLVIHSKKAASESGGNENFLPYFFGFRALGSILGNFYGGRFLEQYGMAFCHKICFSLAAILLMYSYLYKEKVTILEETKNKTFF